MMDYEVGYRRPPKSGQFKKGQSGNPKGKPKGSLNFMTQLEKELNGSIVVTENGKKKKITKLEAIIKRMVNSAMNGEGKAINAMFDLLKKTGKLDEIEMKDLVPENYKDILDNFIKKKTGGQQLPPQRNQEPLNE